MPLLVDAGALFSQADRRDPFHRRVVAALREERGSLITSESVVAEADHLIRTRLGVDVELAFLQDLAEGTFVVEQMSRADWSTVVAYADRYRDLGLGAADISLVVLAKRFRTLRILTLDERHFRAIEPLQGGHFTILPSDR